MINFCLKVKILNDMEDIWVIVLHCKCTIVHNTKHAIEIKEDYELSLKRGIIKFYKCFPCLHHITDSSIQNS